MLSSLAFRVASEKLLKSYSPQQIKAHELSTSLNVFKKKGPVLYTYMVVKLSDFCRLLRHNIFASRRYDISFRGATFFENRLKHPFVILYLLVVVIVVAFIVIITVKVIKVVIVSLLVASILLGPYFPIAIDE